MSENIDQGTNEILKRPDGLSILCVLSFIGSGLALLSNLYMFLLYNSIPEVLQSEELITIPGLDTDVMLNLIQSTSRSFFLFSSVTYAVSLFGVYLMWHLQKRGIHYYAVAQILILIISLLFIGGNYPVLPNLMMSLLFILLYSRFYKIMK